MFNFTGEDSTKCPFGCGGAGDGYGGCAQPMQCTAVPVQPTKTAESTQGEKRYKVIRKVRVYPEQNNNLSPKVQIKKGTYVYGKDMGDGWLKLTGGNYKGKYVKIITMSGPVESRELNLVENPSGGGSKTLKRKKSKYRKSTKRKYKKKGSKKRRKSKKKTKRRR
tara:strand:- start:911 stop:1405 length:495 start_codon:yes stop_codon:yes gene_type:complete